MGLINLKTDLTSLKFGVKSSSDRPGSGNSNQPYIKDPIGGNNLPQSEDFLLRGGLNAPLDAATDVVRLTKMFFDWKSPIGLLFTAKQTLLSRIAARTQASKGWANEGIYTPLSTLTQSGIGFAGGHVNKQGLIPFVNEIRTYSEVMNEQYQQNLTPPTVSESNIATTSNNQPGTNISITLTTSSKNDINNRLYGLWKTKIIGQKDYDYTSQNLISTDPHQVLSYKGGPNSIIGIGKTITYIPKNKNRPNWQIGNNTLTWDSGKLGDVPTTNTPLGYTSPKISDFRAPLLEGKTSSTIMGIAPSYSNQLNNIEGISDSRINLRSPGQKGNIRSYTQGKLDLVTEKPIGAVDKINAQPIYKSKWVKSEPEIAKNDLIKFRIGAVLRDKSKVFIHFRAFIDKFSDSYSAKWSGISYMGRGEDLYKYGGFGRKISLSYTVAAQSKPELMAQYKKLNFLASTLAPDYGSKGYMGGVLTTLTLGGWCYELPGFISSLTLSIPQKSPWEIAIDDNLEEGKGSGDPSVKEMPHICEVSMTFTPIHKFRPELQDNDYDKKTGFVPTGAEKGGYGKQRYIALTNGISENYNDTYRKKVGKDEDGNSIRETTNIGN